MSSCHMNMDHLTVHLIFLILFGGVEHSFGKRECTSSVETDKGLVTGEIFETVLKSVPYAAFRGIPYAKPPVGRLRFRLPEEAEPWSNIFQAVQDENICPQIDPTNKSYVGTEDCLYLNVYTPKTNFDEPSPRDLSPVVVYFHGGGFVGESGIMSAAGPDFLIEEGVVMVSPNFRLGVLGLLALNIPEASGNLQLKDQILALKWIKKNIEKFGGDANSITIFGRSSSGVTVDLHMISDASRGLFHKVISISGCPWSAWGFSSPNQAEERAFGLGIALGIDTNDRTVLFNELTKRPADELIKAQQNLTQTDRKFKPTIEDARIAGDNAFLTECPLRLYKDGNFSSVPYLMIFMKDEMMSYCANPEEMYYNTKLAYSQLNQGSSYIQARLKANQVVFKGHLANPLRFSVTLPLAYVIDVIKNLTDILYTAPYDLKLSLLAKSSAPVYVLRQSYDAEEYSTHRMRFNIDPRIKGAGHGDDKNEIFHEPSKNLPLDPDNYFSKARQRMVRLVANFIKFGNPTPLGDLDPVLNVTWPQSTGSRNFVDFSGDGLKVDSSIADENVRRLRRDLSGFPWESLNGCYESHS